MTASSLEHKSSRGWLRRPAGWRLQSTTLPMADNSGDQTFALRDIREARLYELPSRYWVHYVCELMGR